MFGRRLKKTAPAVSAGPEFKRAHRVPAKISANGGKFHRGAARENREFKGLFGGNMAAKSRTAPVKAAFWLLTAPFLFFYYT